MRQVHCQKGRCIIVRGAKPFRVCACECEGCKAVGRWHRKHGWCDHCFRVDHGADCACVDCECPCHNFGEFDGHKESWCACGVCECACHTGPLGGNPSTVGIDHVDRCRRKGSDAAAHMLGECCNGKHTLACPSDCRCNCNCAPAVERVRWVGR